jgi:hypothetical protein
MTHKPVLNYLVATGLGLFVATQSMAMPINCGSSGSDFGLGCSLQELIDGGSIIIPSLPGAAGSAVFGNFSLLQNVMTTTIPGISLPPPNLTAIEVTGFSGGRDIGLLFDDVGHGEWSSHATEVKEFQTFLTEFTYDLIRLGPVPNLFRGATLTTEMSADQFHSVTESVFRSLASPTLLLAELQTLSPGFSGEVEGFASVESNLTIRTAVTGQGDRAYEGGTHAAVYSVQESFRIPEPGSLWLSLVGLMGLVGLWRSKVRRAKVASLVKPRPFKSVPNPMTGDVG